MVRMWHPATRRQQIAFVISCGVSPTPTIKLRLTSTARRDRSVRLLL